MNNNLLTFFLYFKFDFRSSSKVEVENACKSFAYRKKQSTLEMPKKKQKENRIEFE